MAKSAGVSLIGLVLLGGGAWRQVQVTVSDLTRLETAATQIESAATALKRTDAALASEVLKALADAREEITYLKVKLRREGSVPRADYVDIRDRLDALRIRATGERVSAQPVVTPDPDGPIGPATVAVGTEFDTRLITLVNSATAKVEQRFEVLTLVNIKVGTVLAVPAGTVLRGFVSSVRPSGRVDRRGSLTLSFDEIVLGQTVARLRAAVVAVIDPKVTDDASRMGTPKGALVGVLVGAGGTIASTQGADVDLPAGTVLRLRLDRALDVPAR